MAFTRKMLCSMGISEEQADTIIEAHRETVDGLKDKLREAEEKAEKLEGVSKELDALKAKGTEGYKDKYEQEHKAFEAFKADVAAKETKAAKEKAARAYFEGKNITGKNLAIAMRGARDEIASLDLGKDGEINDTKALDALVDGEFSGLVVTTKTMGAKVSTPPTISGGVGKMTKAEILKIADTAERQKAIAANLSEFGY